MVLMLYYVAGVLLLFVVKNKYSRGNSKEQMQFLYRRRGWIFYGKRKLLYVALLFSTIFLQQYNSIT